MKKEPTSTYTPCGDILYKGTYRGHEIVVVKNTAIGIRCGYIRIAKEACNKHSLEHICENIPLHGGVTYGAHKPTRSHWGDKGYWIGFDCGHLNDAFDLRIMKGELKKFYSTRSHVIGFLFGATVKGTAFVKKNLKQGVDWLVGYERMLKTKAKLYGSKKDGETTGRKTVEIG